MGGQGGGADCPAARTIAARRLIVIPEVPFKRHILFFYRKAPLQKSRKAIGTGPKLSRTPFDHAGILARYHYA
jgi:hypothetical protein